MADDAQKPPTPPEAAADKPASTTPAEPLKGEVSRTDSPGAGVSAAPVAPVGSPAPLPENASAAPTATTAQTSSATGQPTAPAQGTDAQPATKPAAPAAAKPAAAAAKPAAAPAQPAAPA